MELRPSIAEVVAALAVQGIEVPAGNVRLDYYGDSAELSASLIAMIRSGQKRAGTGLLWWHEHASEPYAAEGDIEIVLTHEHQPTVVTRILSVQVVPFAAVTAEYATTEGEGDGSLRYWRDAHWSYFSRLCRSIGREPSEDMPVICSTFEVLHTL